jgi:hypothetical protein
MPHFFFHVRSIGWSLSRDELGLEFPDAETAYREAFRAASAIEDEFAARGQSPFLHCPSPRCSTIRRRGHRFPAPGLTETSCVACRIRAPTISTVATGPEWTGRARQTRPPARNPARIAFGIFLVRLPWET